MFEVNYLSNFLLVLLLLQSMNRKKGRIIFVGSNGTRLDWGPNKTIFSPEQAETLITAPEDMSKGIEKYPDENPSNACMRIYARSKLLYMEWM